ncbi:hypothetical protein F4819DRAFT_473439 [Hypoxylon fuscum]|nr:hypothetical protein F4819DRAFT_473439 [Hypoxylon fuscum]
MLFTLQKASFAPNVHWAFEDPRTGYWIIVMDYIDGKALMDIWGHLSDIKKHDISHRIATITRTMQEKTSSIIGPAGSHPSLAFAHRNRVPPLAMNGDTFTDHINGLVYHYNNDPLRVGNRASYVRWQNGNNFVLSHMQIEPSNIILDKNNKVWLVGWGKGGFFPPECEIAMTYHLYFDTEKCPLIVGALMYYLDSCRPTVSALRAVIGFVEKAPAPVRHYLTRENVEDRTRHASEVVTYLLWGSHF